jgi:hypothetical protein
LFSPLWTEQEVTPNVGQVKDADHPGRCIFPEFLKGISWPCPGVLVTIVHGDKTTPKTFGYARSFVLGKDWVFDRLMGSPDCSWYSAKVQTSGATLTVSIADGPKLAQLRAAYADGAPVGKFHDDLMCGFDVYVRGPKGSSPL